eukprot:7383838-Prymnesium_polylepis.2
MEPHLPRSRRFGPDRATAHHTSRTTAVSWRLDLHWFQAQSWGMDGRLWPHAPCCTPVQPCQG